MMGYLLLVAFAVLFKFSFPYDVSEDNEIIKVDCCNEGYTIEGEVYEYELLVRPRFLTVASGDNYDACIQLFKDEFKNNPNPNPSKLSGDIRLFASTYSYSNYGYSVITIFSPTGADGQNYDKTYLFPTDPKSVWNSHQYKNWLVRVDVVATNYGWQMFGHRPEWIGEQVFYIGNTSETESCGVDPQWPEHLLEHQWEKVHFNPIGERKMASCKARIAIEYICKSVKNHLFQPLQPPPGAETKRKAFKGKRAKRGKGKRTKGGKGKQKQKRNKMRKMKNSVANRKPAKGPSRGSKKGKERRDKMARKRPSRFGGKKRKRRG